MLTGTKSGDQFETVISVNKYILFLLTMAVSDNGLYSVGILLQYDRLSQQQLLLYNHFVERLRSDCMRPPVQSTRWTRELKAAVTWSWCLFTALMETTNNISNWNLITIIIVNSSSSSSSVIAVVTPMSGHWWRTLTTRLIDRCRLLHRDDISPLTYTQTTTLSTGNVLIGQ